MQFSVNLYTASLQMKDWVILEFPNDVAYKLRPDEANLENIEEISRDYMGNDVSGSSRGVKTCTKSVWKKKGVLTFDVMRMFVHKNRREYCTEDGI
ncbi:hypothetical protein NVP1081O_212 [Vibrio phage 1.081.O._10N.286.52.C2]|nr:hypothetical protein NVP1081O_212 [Vibrio phage 1.081.O._10N.286.52.C2]